MLVRAISLDGEYLYPSKVVCVGRNYVDHIEELNNEIPPEPVIFIKPNSSISDEIYFDGKDVVHYEGEISFLVKSGALFGVGFGLDLTKREVQNRLKSHGLPWERAKSFDKSAVFSNFVRFKGGTDAIGMELYINNRLVQKATCKLMLNKPEYLLKEVSSFLSLEDGDLIMTGTPKGVGTIQIGDHFMGKIFNKEELIIETVWLVKE
jgi:2-keto-4-pentenoate hydratase/2-oxohepta-3-ene-1,7-dioic acid hydratase in catechol pathway